MDYAESFDQLSDDMLRNVPPHSMEAEQAVLGGIFLRADALYTLVDIIHEDDFYAPAHRTLFAAIMELHRQNKPVDLLTVGQYLKDKALLEQVGGAVYLGELANSVITAANAEHYATIVRDKSLQRNLIESCSQIISKCYDQSVEIDNLLDESEQAVFSISERTAGQAFVDSKTLVGRVFEELERRIDSKNLVTGVTTGFYTLDKMTAGMQPSDLIIVAARPSMGKTAFTLNLATNAALQGGVPVVFYSLEMGMEQLMSRMIAAVGGVELSKLRTGRGITDEDWQRLHWAADQLGNAPIFIDDTPSLSTLDLRARTRRLKASKNIGMVIVDYLQLMRSSRKTDSRELEISDISRNLKALAKELHIPVIALSQLNRKVEERADKRPMLSDLRESGAIEQDADVIMFIYRDAVYNKKEDRALIHSAEIIIGKQRNGAVGACPLQYNGQFTRFENATDLYPSESLPEGM
ncbi:replicative DNA helicase [Desulfovibrio mangrovi]|nr:replicative DNA helicase [Desulfovibrio mangrovi]UZP69142.1 replicative DNA helicase [Desulfovibrio mangrovi]